MKAKEETENPLAQIKGIAEHAPFGMQIYDVTGHCIYVNKVFERIFGTMPPPGYCVLKDELIRDAGLSHLIEKAFKGEPSQLPMIWYDVRDLKELSATDLAITQKYGKKCAIESHMIPLFAGLVPGRVSHVLFIFKDVTAEMFMRQEREAAIKERDDAKILVRSILDQSQAVIFIKDPEGRYTFVNGQFCRIFKWTPEEILGRSDHELFPRELADDLRANDLRVLGEMTHSEIEEVVPHAGGALHTYVSLKFPLHDSTGRVYGLCGIATDVTRFRVMERELNAAKRMETVGLLAGGIAHDFHNNLGVIILSVDTLLMNDGKKGIDWQKSLQSIKSSAQASAVLTRQLLTFGQKQAFLPRPIDLGAVVAGIELILSNATGEDIKLATEYEPGLWPVLADPVQIEQIITNLCFNARDAMPAGGLLKISVRNVNCARKRNGVTGNYREGSWVELSVEDTGTGMEPEIMERIFEPFFTTKPEGKGSGLGLSTVYGIVHSLGGDIAVDSRPGKGSVFRVYFPRVELAGATADERPWAGAGAAGPANLQSSGRETILVVEDRESLRGVTAAVLENYGYTVLQADGPEAALKLFDDEIKGRRGVDLVVTDLVMPGMSGIELVRRIRATGNLTKPPRVLFVSAHPEEKLLSYGYKCEGDTSAHEFLQKPFTAIELLMKIRAALS
jgi:two-component system, cell cycle sensor histidine kinase and response regulator CckA